jgi:hypothetical protein
MQHVAVALRLAIPFQQSVLPHRERANFDPHEFHADASDGRFGSSELSLLQEK